MIVQGRGGGILVFRQTDHALLSGAFSIAWGNGSLPSFPHEESTVVAAARHDDGWAEWELAPGVDDRGRPIDFIGIPVSEHVRIYRRGIDLVEAEDVYAGCIVSLHGERLYTRPFHPGTPPRIEHLTGEARNAAAGYVDHERERRSRLVRALANEEPVEEIEADLEEAWRLLQVWDRLSLFVCMQPLSALGSATMPPVRGADGEDVAVTVRAVGADVIELDPYPFAEPGEQFEITAIEVSGEQWADTVAFRRAYRGGKRRTVPFNARPPARG